MKEQFKNQLTLSSEEKHLHEKRSKLIIAAGLCLAMFGVFLFLDYTYVFSMNARWGSWIFLLVVMSVLILSYLKVRRKVITLKEVALELETQMSNKSKCVVLTASETLNNNDRAASNLREKLEENLQVHAQKLITERPLVISNILPKFVGFILIAVLLIGYLNMTGMKSFYRIVSPWNNITYTSVTLNEPEGFINKDESILLQGKLAGRAVDDTIAHLSDGSLVPVTIQGDQDFTVELPKGVAIPNEVWVTAGDGISEKIQLEVYETPEIESVRVEVIPPSYARRLYKIEDKLSFSALRASQLMYEITLNIPAKGLRLIPIDTGKAGNSESQQPVQFTNTDEEGLTFQASINLGNNDLTYRLELTSYRNEIKLDDEPHRIHSRPDKIPLIRITENNTSKIKKPTDPLKLTIKTSDDVEVDKLAVVCRKVGEKKYIVNIPVNPKNPWEFKQKAVIKLLELGLQPLDLVIIKAVSWDGNVLDGPGYAESESILFEIPEAPSEGSEAPPNEGGGVPPEVINPLELQKQIFKAVTALKIRAKKKDFLDIAIDQEENIEYTSELFELMSEMNMPPLLLEHLDSSIEYMEQATTLLRKENKKESGIATELALKELNEARKLLPPGET